jgi:tetratricopeptide (TPR) repeat protein
MPSLQKKNIKVEFLSTVIHHTGYLNDEINAQKQNRNLKIMIDEMDDDPTSVTAIKIYSVAGCYQDLKEYSLAKTWYVKALNRAETIGEDPHVIELAPLKIAECLAEEGDYENALKKVEKGIELYPLNPEMMRLKAQILEASQNIKGAFEAYLRLLFYKERQFLFPVDFPKLRFKSIRFMAHYFSETKKELAVEILRLGKKMQEGELLSTQKILSLMYDHEVFLEAKVLLLISLEQDPQPEGYLNLAKLSIILDEAKEAIELLEEGRKFFPSFSELAELKALLYKDLGLTV